jgi:hypothetical protein
MSLIHCAEDAFGSWLNEQMEAAFESYLEPSSPKFATPSDAAGTLMRDQATHESPQDTAGGSLSPEEWISAIEKGHSSTRGLHGRTYAGQLP